MAKYESGSYCIINQGEMKGELARVMKVSCHGSSLTGIPTRYQVATIKHPECIIINESFLDEAITDEEFARFDEACQICTPFNEMATVPGGFDNKKLTVYEKEGNIPHFHFYKNIPINKGIDGPKRHKGGCICILEPKYFIHGNHQEKLDKKEMKSLIKFLNEKNETGTTNWKFMIGLWNSSNPESTQVPYDTPIPEYTYDMENIIGKDKK